MMTPAAQTAAQTVALAETPAATQSAAPRDTADSLAAAATAEAAAADTPAAAPLRSALPRLHFDPSALSAAESAATPGIPRPATDTITYRTVAPAALFGTRSVRAEVPYTVAPAAESPLRTGPFGAATLLALLAYCLLLHRQFGNICHLLAHLLDDHAPNQRDYDETADYPRFLNACTALGLFVLGFAVVRFGIAAVPQQLLDELPRTAALLGCLGVAATLGCVQLYRLGLLYGVGKLTDSRQLTERLWFVKRRMLAFATILATPPLFLLLLTPPATNRFWLWVIIIELFVSVVLYLRETLTLFLSKKISILHWFLYLCIVEIFPLSFCILLAERSIE